MTRHNLHDHLAWFLEQKVSVPSPSTTLPPADESHTASSAPAPPEAAARRRGQGTTQARPIAAHDRSRLDMPRVRPCPGAEAETPDQREFRLPERSPTKLARSIPPLQGAGVPRHDPRSTTVQPPVMRASPRKYAAPVDIEIMDLTDGISLISSPQAKDFEVTPLIGRKRKSEEFEADHRTPSRRTPGRRQKIRPSEEGFTAIEDLVQESPTGAVQVIPSDPPPPYSTVPLNTLKSPSRSQANAKVKGDISSPARSQRQPRVLAVYDSNSDDDIFDFSDRRRKKITPVRSPTIMKPPSPSKEELRPLGRAQAGVSVLDFAGTNARRDSSSKAGPEAQELSGKSIAATPSSTSGTPEDTSCLRKVFFAPRSRLESILRNLDKRAGDLADILAEAADADLDEPDDVGRQLEAVQERLTAVEKLLSQRDLYLSISAEKDRLMAALRQAYKSRSGVEEAKVANAAAKLRLQEAEQASIQLVNQCRDDLVGLLDGPEPTYATDDPPEVAVQSTQQPRNTANEREQVVPSSSRIVQTQMRPTMPPPEPPNPAPHETWARPQAPASRLDTPILRNTSSAWEPMSFADDDIPDDAMLDAGPGLFSHRMGTPPAPFDDDDDDYGMSDDEDMLEVAQGFECPEASASTSKLVATPRRPVSETSGNRQVRPSSASKSKRVVDAESQDIELRNFSFSWSDDVKRALKERFRLKGFRMSQIDAINATLAGKDVFVLMPTGGGKSLCYQLPSLIKSGKTRGVTIVVSPLVSLMEDQVSHLQRLNIQAFFINGDTPAEQRDLLMDKLRDMEVERFISLLYVTPEMLGKSQKVLNAFQQLHRNRRFARIVIDEAHCVSQWGHDFRPDYKALGTIRQKFPGVPVMALTATATENVRKDTIHNLGMTGCEVYTRSFNRSNLYYEVRSKGKQADDIDEIVALIRDKYRTQTGIVYCLSRKSCETFAAALQEKGIKAHHYHAGMPPAEKSQIQRAWQADVYQVIVATIAFGMGIDKANVRFVIHYSIPKSLEGYYQETGRAGRDGRPSGCYLYYAYRDVAMLRKMVDKNEEASQEQRDRQRQMLARMELFCTNSADCRRVQVLNYFGEEFTAAACRKQCDNCNSNVRFKTVDLTRYARKAVALVADLAGENVYTNDVDDESFAKELTNRITTNQLIDIFKGSGAKKIKDAWSDLSEFGAGRDLDRGDVERLIHRLLSEGTLHEVQVVNKMGFPNQYVSLGRHRNMYAGARKFEMMIRNGTSGKAGQAVKKRKTKKGSNDGSDDQPAVGRTVNREMPMSTNVSSPVQAASKRSKASSKSRAPRKDVDSGSEFEDESDDAFEPVRVKGKSNKSRLRQTGPPITSDPHLDQLNPVSREIVDDFVHHAEAACKDIMLKKNLRYQPFTRANLQDMAIAFADTEAKMLQIRGIDPEKVKLYGRTIIKLLVDLREFHHAAMGEQDQGCDEDDAEMISDDDEDGLGDHLGPHRADKHAENVIDLVSDDEGGGSGPDPHESDTEQVDDEPGERSRHFADQPFDREVVNFNSRFSQGLPAAERHPTEVRPPRKSKPKRSTFTATAANNNGVRKRPRNGGPRRSNGANGSKPSWHRKRAAGSAAGSRAIAMMPT